MSWILDELKGLSKDKRFITFCEEAIDLLGEGRVVEEFGELKYQMHTNKIDHPDRYLISLLKKQIGQQKASISIPSKSDKSISIKDKPHRILSEVIQTELAEAKEAGTLGYLSRCLAQTSLPHSDLKLPPGTIYSRDTGKLKINIVSTDTNYGIPYGTIPRMILQWICTNVVKNKSRNLSLGHSQSEFMKIINLNRNGRDIERFRKQSLSLIRSVISLQYTNDKDIDVFNQFTIADSSYVFWNRKAPDHQSLWESTVTISEKFYNEIIGNPVPIDLRIFHALSKSPLAMDIYVWLTYRIFLLQRSRQPRVIIPWICLQNQFGAGYPNTVRGLTNFKHKFLARLKDVLSHYPLKNCNIEDIGESFKITILHSLPASS